MRDLIKNKKYFFDIIEDNNKRIIKYNRKLEEILFRGLDDTGVKVCRFTMVGFHCNSFGFTRRIK